MSKRVTSVLAVVVAVAFATGAHAAGLEVSEWSQRFNQAALKSDSSEMMGLVEEAKDSRLDSAGMKVSFDSIAKFIPNQQATYADQIIDEKIGNMFERVTTGVMYKNQALFYTTTFMREAEGWKIIYFNFNTDVNNVLHAAWPK